MIDRETEPPAARLKITWTQTDRRRKTTLRKGSILRFWDRAWVIYHLESKTPKIDAQEANLQKYLPTRKNEQFPNNFMHEQCINLTFPRINIQNWQKCRFSALPQKALKRPIFKGFGDFRYF